MVIRTGGGVGGISRNFNYTINKLGTDPINSEAEWLQLCNINKNTQSAVVSELQDASSCLSFLKRKPSDQLNTDTKLPSVAYYLTRHKTTGAEEAECQYAAFSSLFTAPLKCTSKSTRHYAVVEHAVIFGRVH